VVAVSLLCFLYKSDNPKVVRWRTTILVQPA
jgi:hypothetical protein